MWIKVCLFLCFALGFGPWEETYTLYLRGPALSQSEPVMVRGFMSLPQGKILDAHSLQLLDSKGRTCPCDLRSTVRWKDGSIRCLCAKAVVEGSLACKTLRLVHRRPTRLDAGGIVWEREKSSLKIDTGPLILLLSSLSPALIEEITVEGREFFSLEGALNLKIDLNGESFRSLPNQEVLQKKGKAETAVILRGNTGSIHGTMGPKYEMYLYIYAGSSLINCTLKVFGEGFEGMSQGMFLRFDPAFSDRASRIVVLNKKRDKGSSFPADREVKLVSERHRVFYRYETKEELFSHESTVGMMASTPGRSFCLSLPEFGLLHPWSVFYAPRSGFCLSMLSDSFQWESAMVYERDFGFWLGGGSLLRNPILGTSGPARATSFGLPKTFEHRTFPCAPEEEDRVQDPLWNLYLEVSGKLHSLLKREWNLWDGFRDFGDYRMENGQFANCEFDPVYGLLKRFLITGELDDFVSAEVMLKHWLRFDRTHPGDPGFPGGLPWVHGIDHRSMRIEAGHMWVDGPLLFYQMTDEKKYLEAALAIGRYMLGLRVRAKTQIRERSAAWALMALTALVDSGIPGFEEAMDYIASRIRDRQTKAGYFRFDQGIHKETTFYTANSWVTAGITLEALSRHFILTSDPRSLASLQNGVEWLMTSCRDKITGQWHQRLYYDLEDENLLIQQEGMVRNEDKAFLALGLARAGYLLGDARGMGLARSTLKQGLLELRSRLPCYPGRALAVVTRSAPEVILSTRGFRQRR